MTDGRRAAGTMDSCALAVGLVLVAGAGLSGCATVQRRVVAPLQRTPPFDEAHFARKPLAAHALQVGPGGAPAATVVGRSGTYRIRKGDTLLDVARYYDLGYNEIVEANPGVDPWIPPVGSSVVLPTEWVLPCCTYTGLVLNIPEMRLYAYERSPTNAEQLLVRTYPVGLGRPDRRTPRGSFRIRGKTVNPTWVVPESIRQEHIREHNDARRSIPGGHPDNPLGKYRLELTIPSYTIHGTNIPWGAGMPVSHGCARLYPEDIEDLFPRVKVGTPVEFVYQPVKVGRRGGDLWVEAHPDIYGLGKATVDTTNSAMRRGGGKARFDRKAVEAALKSSRGMPVKFGRDEQPLRVRTIPNPAVESDAARRPRPAG